MKKKTGTLVVTAAAVVLYFGFASPAFAPVDMFLKIDGIDGESKDADHDKWIDVLSWSWGETSSSAGAASGRRSSPGEGPGTLTISKSVDKSSPKLTQACNSGRSLPKATVSDGARTYTLYNVRLSCTTSGAAGDRPTEEIAFYYNKISFSEAKPKRMKKDNKR